MVRGDVDMKNLLARAILDTAIRRRDTRLLLALLDRYFPSYRPRTAPPGAAERLPYKVVYLPGDDNRHSLPPIADDADDRIHITAAADDETA